MSGGEPRPPTVLVADSDVPFTQQVRRMLEQNGYTVLVTHADRQTLQTLYDRQPDLVVLGQQLYAASGEWLCEKIKHSPQMSFIPLVLLVDYRAFDEHQTVECSQVDVVLPWPSSRLEFERWLETLLRLKHRFDGQIQRLAQRAGEIEALKSDIIANVSHELGTPLLQVKSALSMLAEDLNDDGSPVQLRLSNMAVQAIGRLEESIDNIRQLARTHDIHLEPIVLNEAVTLALNYLRRRWASRNAVSRITSRVPEGLPLVLADKRAVGRLLQLLLDNALKFSDDDLPVLILSTRLDTHHVWIGVQDFGIGIPEDLHCRIFEPFFQVDGSSTRRYGGTGSGLALARLLAQGLNTTVDVKSAPGEGSTFSFVLPVAAQD